MMSKKILTVLLSKMFLINTFDLLYFSFQDDGDYGKYGDDTSEGEEDDSDDEGGDDDEDDNDDEDDEENNFDDDDGDEVTSEGTTDIFFSSPEPKAPR